MATATLPPSLRMKHRWPQRDREEYIQRVSAETLTFEQFIRKVKPDLKWYRHVEIMVDVLQRVADGEITRLMIFMPPRHGKTELVSRLFTAYYLYRFPHKWVGLTSYGATLAYKLSRASRGYYRQAGGAISPESASVKHWETGQGGGMWSDGVAGSMTGSGFHLGIVDDPVKNAEEAQSEVLQEKQRDWWDSTFYTREEPGGAIVVVQTRWNENDLSGYLLDIEGVGEHPENWHIIHFEAIKEDDAPEYPSTCTVEPDWREPGEALAPLRYSLEKLKKIASKLGSYFWNCLYQQRPHAREGGMFKRAKIEIVKAVPAGASFVRYWDKAGSVTKSASYTATVLMAEKDGVYYIADMMMTKLPSGEREKLITQYLETDRQRYGNVTTWVEQEPGSGGKESAENTIKNNPGFIVKADKVTGSKELRAEPLAAQVEVENVKMVAAPWNETFLRILASFPAGTKDPVDAASGAFNKLVKKVGSKIEAVPNPFYQ